MVSHCPEYIQAMILKSYLSQPFIERINYISGSASKSMGLIVRNWKDFIEMLKFKVSMRQIKTTLLLHYLAFFV